MSLFKKKDSNRPIGYYIGNPKNPKGVAVSEHMKKYFDPDNKEKNRQDRINEMYKKMDEQLEKDYELLFGKRKTKSRKSRKSKKSRKTKTKRTRRTRKHRK